MAQQVKNLSAMQDTQVPSLGWEEPLKEEMATHSSILAWGIPLRGAGRATVHRVEKSQTRQRCMVTVKRPVCMHATSLSCVPLSATPWVWPTRLLCPRDSPGKHTGVGCHALLRGSSRPRDRTQVSYFSRMAGSLCSSAAWEAPK